MRLKTTNDNEFGIDDPYQLTEEQFNAAVDLLTEQGDDRQDRRVLELRDRPDHRHSAAATCWPARRWQYQVNNLPGRAGRGR